MNKGSLKALKACAKFTLRDINRNLAQLSYPFEIYQKTLTLILTHLELAIGKIASFLESTMTIVVDSADCSPKSATNIAKIVYDQL